MPIWPYLIIINVGYNRSNQIYTSFHKIGLQTADVTELLMKAVKT